MQHGIGFEAVTYPILIKASSATNLQTLKEKLYTYNWNGSDHLWFEDLERTITGIITDLNEDADAVVSSPSSPWTPTTITTDSFDIILTDDPNDQIALFSIPLSETFYAWFAEIFTYTVTLTLHTVADDDDRDIWIHGTTEETPEEDMDDYLNEALTSTTAHVVASIDALEADNAINIKTVFDEIIEDIDPDRLLLVASYHGPASGDVTVAGKDTGDTSPGQYAQVSIPLTRTAYIPYYLEFKILQDISTQDVFEMVLTVEARWCLL